MSRVDDKVADALAALSIGASRHARATLIVILLLTAGFGYGLTTITTNVDVADVLPRGNYNTEAAHNLTAKFRSTFTQQVTLQLHVDESQSHWARDNAKLIYRNQALPVASGGPGDPSGPGSLAPNPHNITDEVYVRATAELVEFIQARTEFSRSISISNIYNLINWTLAGGEGSDVQPPADEGAFNLPGYESRDAALRYQVVDQTVKAAVLDTVDAIASPSWNHQAALFMPAANNAVSSRVLGQQMLAVRDEYVQAVRDGKTEFTVFGPDNPPLVTVDLPIANAHSSFLVREDIANLMWMVVVFIIVCLFIAFRNIRAMAVSLVAMSIGVVWAYGTMGFLGIALNTLNMTIVPLILGVGIDYAIHIINEFAEHKSEGMTDEQAFRRAGRRTGLALLIASLTTIGGLLFLVASPSLLIAQLGLVSAVALAVMYLVTVIFIPAALTLVGGSERMGSKFTRSKIMPALGHAVSKVRYAVLVLILVGSVFAYTQASQIGKEAFGDPGRNYPADDPIRKEHEKGLAYFYEAPNSDEKANILTFSGTTLLTPEAMAYYREIEANLKTQPRVIPDTLRTLPFFIETWQTVRGGAPGAVENIVAGELLGIPLPVPLPEPVEEQVNTFPTTEEELTEAVNSMFESPMRELSSIIINYPANDMAAMTFSVRAATYDEAAEVWDQIWSAVGKANATFGGHPPGDIKVAFVGNTATNYLFIAKQLPWLTYMNIVSNIILVVLVFLLTRSPKATLVTLAISTLTSLWWLAVLPSLGIGLAITLTLPLAFIIAIGTDYAVHFIWNIRATQDPRAVFESTGKAVLFSAITTTGAFLFFIPVQNVAVSRTMVATSIAFVIIFVVTVLMIPAFYRVRAKHEPAPEAAAPRVVAEETQVVAAAKPKKSTRKAHPGK